MISLLGAPCCSRCEGFSPLSVPNLSPRSMKTETALPFILQGRSPCHSWPAHPGTTAGWQHSSAPSNLRLKKATKSAMILVRQKAKNQRSHLTSKTKQIYEHIHSKLWGGCRIPGTKSETSPPQKKKKTKKTQWNTARHRKLRSPPTTIQNI